MNASKLKLRPRATKSEGVGVPSKRDFSTWVIAAIAAAVLGSGTAFATAPAQGAVASVSASTHCTRYVPNTSVDWQCGQITYNPVGILYTGETSGAAARDMNFAGWTSQQSYQFYYRNASTNAAFGQTSGYASSASTGGSGGVVAYAACQFENSPTSDYNHCTTNWH
jgi:hypothetical protein